MSKKSKKTKGNRISRKAKAVAAAWTDKDLATMKAMSKAGKTYAEIAKKLRRSEAAVRTRACRL